MANPFHFPTMPIDEYLGRSAQSVIQYEYDGGVMYPMAEVNEDHNITSTNLVTILGQQVESTACNVFAHRMRVTPPGERIYYHPDILVTCGEREFEIRGEIKTLLNPRVILEIFSAATEEYDKNRKWEIYQQIPSLMDYLLVAQDRVHITHYTRQQQGWTSQDYRELTDEIDLPSIGCKLPLARVYKKVTWA